MTTYTESEPETPEYDMDVYTDEEEDGYSDQLAGEQLSRIQERKAEFNNYESDGLNVLDQLRTPMSADDLITAIHNAHFLASTERRLIHLVQTYISTDTLLANIENMELANNLFESSLTEILISANKTDTNRKEWLSICSNMRSSVKLTLTRTHGPYRERRLQDQNRAEVVTGKLTTAEKQQNAAHSVFKLPFGKK